MKYYVKIQGIRDEIVGPKYTTFSYESNIEDTRPYRHHKEANDLRKEIIEHFKNKSEFFNECDYVVIEQIVPSHLGIQWEYLDKGKELSDELYELYEESKKECDLLSNKDSERRKYLISTMEDIINELKYIRDEAISLNMLDSQEFINYQDTLNKYSLDPDRE